MEQGKALQIGAGNIGRALIGDVMHEAGLHVTFADIHTETIDAINAQGGYAIDVVSAEETRQQWVHDISAVSMKDEVAVVQEIVEADIITTAVGVNVLPHIAPLLARGLMERLKKRPKDTVHVAVVACENVENNSAILQRLVGEHMPNDEWRRRLHEHVSFPNCAVDRIVPNKTGVSTTLNVTTEDYFQLAIDKTALIADIPIISGVQLVDDLGAVLMQKLFTLNGAHAAAAYWGHLKGYETIDQAMQDKHIQALIAGLMQEVSTVLTAHYPTITEAAQAAFVQKTLRRFCNPHLRDEPKRVGREPARKLGGADRLVKPAVLSLAMQEHPANTLMAIVGGLHYRESGDAQSLEIGEKISREGIEESFVAITGLARSHPLTRYVSASYRTMELAA